MTVQTGDAPRAERLARMLASPTGVLIAIPALVGAVGVAILLLGRSATRDATDSMARRQLASQAVDVQHDVGFALDQAEPMIARLRELADPRLPIAEVAVSLRDLQLGRAGIVNTSIGFPSGTMRGSYVEDGEVRVQESILGPNGTLRTNYKVAGGVVAIATKTTDYDVRKRSHYELAVRTRTRAWTPPRVYFTSHTTGVTCVEPVYGAGGALAAVVTVDFDVGALSQFVVRAPLEGARTIVFSGDGAILAFPGAAPPAAAATENRLLRYSDYDDPAMRGLFETLGNTHVPEQRFVTIHADDEDYLASVAPVGGVRAGVAAPLDWYLATVVPEHVLLGPTRRLERRSILASAAALAMALGVALVFAWNVVRMRRAVGEARERARSAEAHARDLGSYRLVARLGAGGMGEVWRAEHRLLVRQAAIKIVRADKLRDRVVAAKIRERFRREAQTLAQLRSRHTIALFDYGVSEDGVFFYVMELLDGLDLEKLVREFGPQSSARVISILVQACQSLGEANDAGLLHRDIKPANLMLCREADEIDVVKLLDFGIVHAMTEGRDPLEAVSLPPDVDARYTARSKLTMHGAVVGTPGFIAPEQVLGTGVDARSDLYALGCVAWWLLTATEVFGRPDEESAMRAHAEEAVPPLRPRVRGWLPDALESLVLACLAKKREDRPASARDLAAALRAIDIPAEHAWTEDRARAWWSVHRPVETRQDGVPTAEVPERVLVPQRVRDVDLDAPTVEARRVR